MRLSLDILKTFVEFFKDENGHSSECYNAVYELIEITLGKGSADVFSSRVDATDGGFYFDGDAGDVWNDMLVKSEVKSDYELILRLTDQYGMQEEKDEGGQLILYTNLRRDERQQVLEFAANEKDEDEE